MIFKPKVKQKITKILAKAPVFLLLALVCLVGHPARAEAADDTVLRIDMTYFTKIGEYKITQTTGERLKEMFKLSTSSLKDSKQYITYYEIDTKATSGHTWSTYYSYWHTKKWNYCVPTIDRAKNTDGYLWGYYVEGSRKTSGAGKISFTGKYKTNLSSTSWNTVPDGKIGTLHFFCTDAGTTTGDKFNSVMDEEDGTVTFYISSIMKCNGCTNNYYYSLDSWYNHHNIGWKDRNKENYRVHYNQKVKFKADGVVVKNMAYIVGSQKDEDSTLLYQSNLKVASSNKRYVREIKDSDYLWGGKEDGKLLFKDLSTHTLTYISRRYSPYSSSTYVKYSPLYNKNTSYGLTGVSIGRKSQRVMCVGYRITKHVEDSQGNGNNIILASSMIELHKGTSGDYLPYYVEEKEQEAANADTANGETVSIPKNVKNRTVTVMRYDKYVKSTTGKAVKSKHFKSKQQVTVKEWLDDMNEGINWGNYEALGIRNTSSDKTTSISIMWFYAPYDDEEETSKVTLEQYYATEKTNISTKEFPSVDDSADLSYKHDSKSTHYELAKTTTLATVNEGDPWVSYNVERKGESYKLKDGTYSPKSRYKPDSSGTIKVTTSKKKKSKFQNTDPECDFKSTDLIPIKDSNSGLSNSRIPIVLNRSGKGGNSATCNNYLYKIVISTSKDEVWTEFTADDIWKNVSVANGKIVTTSPRGIRGSGLKAWF